MTFWKLRVLLTHTWNYKLLLCVSCVFSLPAPKPHIRVSYNLIIDQFNLKPKCPANNLDNSGNHLCHCYDGSECELK